MNTKLLNFRVLAHGKEKEFTDADLRAVQTPSSTTRRINLGTEKERDIISWQPIGHLELVEQFRTQVKANKLNIVQEYLTLDREGDRFFGLFQIEGLARDPFVDASHIGTVLGLRNSHDKKFPVGIFAGDAPFICTNLAFNNEVVLGRKHTARVWEDLPLLISRAIGKLTTAWSNQDKRIRCYCAHEVNDAEAHHLAVQAFRNGAITKTQIADVVEQWHKPEHVEFEDRNGWSLYNAFTNVLRGNVGALGNRSNALHGTLDIAFGLHSKPVSEVISV